jgi:hypothetical protein
MFDTVQFVAQTLATPDALTTFALRFLCVLILGVSLAILLIGAGFVLALCCRGDRRGAIPAAFLLLLPPMLAGIAAADAQETGSQPSIPEVVAPSSGSHQRTEAWSGTLARQPSQLSETPSPPARPPSR